MVKIDNDDRWEMRGEKWEVKDGRLEMMLLLMIIRDTDDDGDERWKITEDDERWEMRDYR